VQLRRRLRILRVGAMTDGVLVPEPGMVAIRRHRTTLGAITAAPEAGVIDLDG
jgi:hypothetical protein